MIFLLGPRGGIISSFFNDGLGQPQIGSAQLDFKPSSAHAHFAEHGGFWQVVFQEPAYAHIRDVHLSCLQGIKISRF